MIAYTVSNNITPDLIRFHRQRYEYCQFMNFQAFGERMRQQILD